jgi:tetratricopeptide (TPR) repeat protein
MDLQGIALTHEGYRPLLLVDHMIDRRLFDRAPAPMHVHNLLLGVLAIGAAFWLALLLFGRAAPALVVTAIFAWHPFHVEPICFLTARADTLSGLFALLAAALVVRIAPPGRAAAPPRARVGLAIGAGLFMFLSSASKEANLLLPLGLGGVALATGRLRAWRYGLLALVAGAAAYAALRTGVTAHAPAATHADRIAKAIAALPSIILEYARSFALPFDMSISRPVYLPSPLGWAIALAIAAGVIVALKRAPASWRPDLSLAASGAWLAAALIAPAAVAVFSEGAVADRYAFMAVFGFAVAAVAVGARAATTPRRRRAVAALTAGFLGLCLFVSAREVSAWASDEALYTHAVAVEPDSVSAHNRFGRLLAEHGAWTQAITELEHAAALPDGVTDHVLDNLGVAYLNVGRVDDAERVFRRALAVSGELSYHAWYNLGTVRHLRGDGNGACAAYRRALAVSPHYERALADVQRYCATPTSPAPTRPDAAAPSAP